MNDLFLGELNVSVPKYRKFGSQQIYLCSGEVVLKASEKQTFGKAH